MDSTDPQPKQQTQQPPPPPPPQQQQPQPHQHQHQQPQPPPPQQQQQQQQQRPQIHPQAHQHPPQSVHTQQTSFPPLAAYPTHHAPYGPYSPRYPTHGYAYPPPYPSYYPPQQPQPPPPAWQPTPANTYPAHQAQPLANMVAPQPQTNVPHNKSTQIISGPLVNQDQRLHNQTLQTVTLPNQQAPTITKVRERKPATLKDPCTKKEVPLPNTTNSSSTTKSSTKPSSNVEHVQNITCTLLQKVSEDDKENENKQNNSVDKKEGINKDNQQNQKDNQKLPTIQQKQNDKGINNKLAETKEQNEKQKPQAEKSLEEVVVKVVKHDEPQQLKQSQPNQQQPHQKQRELEQLQEQELKPQPKNEQQNNNDDINKKGLVDEKKVVVETDNNGKDILEENIKETNRNGQENGGHLDNDKEEDNNDVVDNQEENEKTNPLEALTYETWQYNPISNREGKKIYSRQFLYDVCEKVVGLDVLHKDNDDKIGMEGNGLQSAFNQRIDLFAPGFSSNSQRFNPTNRQNETSRRQSQQNYAGRSSAGQERQRKVITSVSLTQEVELKTTSNPWRPTKEIKEDAPNDEEVETESLKKKFRSILNKLTPNNFENLARAVTDLNIDTESKLGEVIDIVFAKALAEPGYCVLYGQMCSHLKKVSAGTANFGNTLLKRCQHQFQSDIYAGINIKERKEKIEAEEDPEVKKQLNEELYEDMFRCRMRGLGLIKFIGELYKIEMLNDKIMFDCVLRLLQDTSEESLECLCDLLATIGEKLDRSTSQKNNEKEKKAPKSASKAIAYTGGQKSAAAVVASGSAQQQQLKAAAEQQTMITSLDQVFEQLHKIRKNKDLDLSVRIRFKLLDTCELREKDNWMSKKTKDNNPKKIDEIREAHKEKLEQERRQQNAMGPRRSQEGRRGLGNSGGSSNQLSSLAMESGGNRGQSNMHTSSSSHLIRDHSIGDNNMKSNHDDIENQKEHQKKLENLKGITSLLKNLAPSNKTSLSSGESLRPNTQIYTRKKP